MPEQKRLAIYNLAARRTRTIGVIVHRLDGQFISSALRGIQEVARESQYDCVIAHSQDEKAVADTRLLFPCGVDGMLEIGIPVVSFDRTDQTFGSGRVITDNRRCGYLASGHLIDQGCRRIVLSMPTLQQNSAVRLYMGFLEAAKKYNQTSLEDLLSAELIETEDGADVAQKVLRMDPLPDGLFIADDQAAVVCIHALKEAGVRVPDDIAVVGLNNDPIGRLIAPALTTIDYPGYEIGKTAASTLLDQLAGHRAAPHRTTALVPPVLIVRSSSVRSQTACHSH